MTIDIVRRPIEKVDYEFETRLNLKPTGEFHYEYGYSDETGYLFINCGLTVLSERSFSDLRAVFTFDNWKIEKISNSLKPFPLIEYDRFFDYGNWKLDSGTYRIWNKWFEHEISLIRNDETGDINVMSEDLLNLELGLRRVSTRFYYRLLKSINERG